MKKVGNPVLAQGGADLVHPRGKPVGVYDPRPRSRPLRPCVVGEGGLALALALALVCSAAFAQDREQFVISSLTNSATVVVGWQEQYEYGVAAGSGGSVQGTTNDWYDSGTAISNQAVANLHYQFTHWTGAPAGKETENPLMFSLTNAYTNVAAVFGLVDYSVGVTSKYTNWFGEAAIGNPAGAGNFQALSTVTVSVDRIVIDPENPGRRLRVKSVSVE